MKKISIKTPDEIFNIITNFINREALSGILLLVCASLAIAIANSSFSEHYFEFWHQKLGVTLSSSTIAMSLAHWVNDGLMALFFLMVGLEIKRELIAGELSSFKRASFPIIAALGGMITPAIIYLILNPTSPESLGFGVPMATDIAFALGILMLFRQKVPLALKIFLVSLAVVDDLGAILVIAIFYTDALNYIALLYSSFAIAILLIMNFFGARRLSFYLIVGGVLWIFILKSGIHATIAGVILAMCIPLRSKIGSFDFLFNIEKILENFCENRACSKDKILLNEHQLNSLEAINRSYIGVQNPLVRLEHALHPVSAYVIMPLFAFANAGVVVNMSQISSHLHIFFGIYFGLLVGKPLGIFTLTYLADKIGVAKKPDSILWADVLIASLFAGIGFTMSIFISNLAFVDKNIVDVAKSAIVFASLSAATLGSLLIASKY